MKKSIIAFITFFVIFVSVYNVKAAPSENQDEQGTQVDYIKGRKLTDQEIEEQKKHEPKNLVSMPILEEQQQMEQRINDQIENRLTASSYEKKYDARNYNLVTEVKDQGIAGWCWDYSILSCAETSMIKNKVNVNGKTATVNNTDLSEAAVAYYLYNRTCVEDPLKGSKGDSNNFTDPVYSIRDYSGNTLITSNFLSTWMSPKNESYYSIDMYGYDNPAKPNTKKAYTNNDAVVKNVLYIYGNNDMIKQAIKDYGSASVSFQWDSYYFNYDTAAFYNPFGSSTNHSVTVVGWDDTYSKKNFNNSSYIKNNGAWIVKNSWSDEWGDDGYFYMSYEDESLYPMCAIEMQSAGVYNNNYFYDGTAGISASYVSNNSMIANEFVANGNKNGSGKETLEAVSFVIDDSLVDYSIQVYKNITNPKNPLSGTKALSKEVTGTTKNAGLYTVELNQKITLDKGERYSVVITLKSPYQWDVGYGIECADSYGWISFTAKTSANQSFYKEADSSKWIDLANDNECARIKAYTNNYKKVVFRDGTKVLKTQYVAKGDAATAPVATKTGYTFVKWDKSYKNVQSDMYVNAVWKGYNYTIRFNANGGKNTMKDMACVYGKTYTLTANTFSKSGYSMIGFSRKSDGSSNWYANKQKVGNMSTSQNGIVTLYAQWAKNTKITSLKSTKRGTLTVKYAKTDSKQTGYQIVYSTNRNFTTSTTKKITVKGYSNVSKTISSLKKGKKYYIKVRTYKTVGSKIYYGAYSSAKSVTVKK